MSSQSVTTLKNTRFGKMLFFRHDKYIGRSLDLYGEFSVNEAVLFAQLLAPGDVAIDVGANIGAHTLQFARLVGPTGQIYAIEPQRVIHQVLCANMVLNEQFNVVALHAAAGAQPGSLRVPTLNFARESNFGGYALTDAAAGESVPVITLDSLDLRALKLLKIDVEGMEYSVLEGARQQIAKHRPFIYAENDRKANSADLIRLLTEMEYTLWWHLPTLFNPHNFYANATNVFGRIVSINLFCVPAESTLVLTDFRRVTGPEDWYENWPAS
jgi:FkbM family methyltransferase